MSTWQAIALTWIAIGAACVITERALRDAHQDCLGNSVVSALILLILGPFVVAYGLALVVSQPFLTLWRGKIPLLEKPWWPERAKKFEKGSDLQSDDSTLCQMIELRRSRDPVLRRGPTPLTFLCATTGVHQSMSSTRLRGTPTCYTAMTLPNSRP
jgi:hypothetical protein